LAFETQADTIASAVTVTAGAADVTLPSATGIDTQLTQGGYIDITVTNGATGPTLPCDIGIQVAESTTDTWITVGDLLVADLGNDIVTRFKVNIPTEAQNVRLLVGGNTAQDVTISAAINSFKRA